MTAPGALEGVVVADFTRVLAGPLATMTLGDLGAEVVKVERPAGGDDTRAWGPPWAGEQSSYYLGFNRNKRSITLDLTDDADRALARELARRADVLVENFRPGTMERFDLGYEQVAEDNPGLVYCSITGFGSGAGADLPGYDLLVQAMGGLMSLSGEPEGDPTKAGVALVDMVCGLYAVIGIMAALEHRRSHRTGQRVEVSLLDAGLAALLNAGSAFVHAGVVQGRQGNRHPSIAPYEVLRAQDGPMVLAVGNDAQWQRLCTVLERPDLAADETLATNEARVRSAASLAVTLEKELGRAPVAEWAARFREAAIPAGPINDVAGAFALARELGLEPVAEVADGQVTPRSPLRLSETPVQMRRSSPALGADSESVRAWLLGGAA